MEWVCLRVCRHHQIMKSSRARTLDVDLLCARAAHVTSTQGRLIGHSYSSSGLTWLQALYLEANWVEVGLDRQTGDVALKRKIFLDSKAV